VILSSALVTTFTRGATFLTATGVRSELGSLIVGFILLFSACGGFIKIWIERKKQQAEDLLLEKKIEAKKAQGTAESPQESKHESEEVNRAADTAEEAQAQKGGESS
jgi:ABC-type uncharacterized transport system permease subunit